MLFRLIGLVVLVAAWVCIASAQPKTLGCDAARDLLGWEQCQTLEHRIFFVGFRGCGKGDSHAYLVRGPGKQALVCCGLLFKGCTARSERP